MCRWYDGTFRRPIELRHPSIRVTVTAKDIAEEQTFGLGKIVWVYVLPNNFAVPRHLENAPTVRFGDQCIAIWQSLGAALVSTVETAHVFAAARITIR